MIYHIVLDHVIIASDYSFLHLSYQCRNSHCGDKKILQPSFFPKYNSYTSKISILILNQPPAFQAVFCLLIWVSSDYAQPIARQVTEVACPGIGQAQPELTPSKRQKTGPGWCLLMWVGMAEGWHIYGIHQRHIGLLVSPFHHNL